MNKTVEPIARSWVHILTNGPHNRGVAGAEKSATVSPSAPCGRPQEHQVEKPAPVHFPDYDSTVRDKEDSSAQRMGQTPAQFGDDLSTDHEVLHNPLVEVKKQGMEMSNGNLKQHFRETQVNPQEEDVQGIIMDIENDIENA